MCGIYLTLVSGWVIILIGFLAILAAVTYSGGPFAYGYKGLGELFVFIFFGFAAVCGTYYAQAVSISLLALFSSIPVGLFIVAILVVNNLRDIESDRAAGKRTLAVRKGDGWARQEFIGLLAFAYLVVFLLGFTNLTSPWILLSWISLPVIYPLSRSVINDRGRILNKTLAATGLITFIFSLLYAAGLVLSVYFPV
jgi:1,4-dihydroxy-2-naphthoate octaprenyltransferase